MEERDRERLERLLDAITLAGNAEMVSREIAELRALAVKAQDVEQAGLEAKLAKYGSSARPGILSTAWTSGWSSSRSSRTRSTTSSRSSKPWGFKVATIHGGMKPGARD